MRIKFPKVDCVFVWIEKWNGQMKDADIDRNFVPAKCCNEN